MTTPRAFRVRMIIGVVALLGLLVALYLSVYYMKLAQNVVCPGGECDKVRASSYAYPLGIPMPVFGVVGYGLILFITLKWMIRKYIAKTRVPVGLALLGLTGFGLLFSLFLTYLEAFVIHAFCFWCVTSAVIMAALFGLAVLAWWWEREPEPETAPE